MYGTYQITKSPLANWQPIGSAQPQPLHLKLRWHKWHYVNHLAHKFAINHKSLMWCEICPTNRGDNVPLNNLLYPLWWMTHNKGFDYYVDHKIDYVLTISQSMSKSIHSNEYSLFYMETYLLVHLTYKEKKASEVRKVDNATRSYQSWEGEQKSLVNANRSRP